MKKISTSIIFTLILFIIASCSSPDYETKIIGDWETTMIDGKAPKSVSCMTIKEGGTVRFYYLDERLTKWDDEQGKGLGTWSIDGSTLTLDRNKMKLATYTLTDASDSELKMTSDGRFKLKLEYKKRN